MIRKALLLLVPLVFAATARGQFSAYGAFTLDHLTGTNSSPILQTLSPLPCTGGATTGCTSYKNAVDPIGFTGGVTWDFKNVGPVLLSADARGVIESSKQGAQVVQNGAGTRIYSVLGGVKATIHTPLRFLSPYVEGAGGYGRSNYGVLTNAGITNGGNPTYPGIPTENNIEYHVFAGADVRVLPALDWRVAELGYGALQATGNFSHTYPILSISTGFVFHIPPRQ